ncbi:MAG: thioredoxin family protein [Candidatus Paceibacterota bacterium]
MTKQMHHTGSATPAIIGVLAILAIIGGIVFFMQSSPSTSEEVAMEEENTTGETATQEEPKIRLVMEEESDVTTEEETPVESSPVVLEGGYSSFDERKLAFAENGDVVLFFAAKWCPTCRAADKDITANASSIPNDLLIMNVDYDNSTELRKKYNVIIQHTFVQVDADGNLIQRWSGGDTLASVVAKVE